MLFQPCSFIAEAVGWCNEQIGKLAGFSPAHQKQLASFLRKRRGKATYAEFARKLGISPSTLFRLENAEQSATLQVVERVTKRLKCALSDIFKEG